MKKGHLSRKEHIIYCAIDIINELGIHSLSIREIARRQGVSEASLYKHFTSKKDILIGVIQYSTIYDDAIMKTIETKELSPIESIIFFVKSFGEVFENYPAMVSIMHSYYMLIYEEDTGDLIKKILNKRTEFILGLINEAKSKGELKDYLEGENLTELILSVFFFLTLKWKLNNYNFKLKERMLKDIEALLH